MIVIASERGKYQFLEPSARRVVKSALRKLRIKKVGVEVNFVSNKKMRELNRAFRHKDKTTNVLAFEALVDFPHPHTLDSPLGEIYLAPDFIKSKKENIEFLLIHGLLHLLGYDHLKKRDRIKMEKIEQSLCRALSLD